MREFSRPALSAGELQRVQLPKLCVVSLKSLHPGMESGDFLPEGCRLTLLSD